MGRLFLNGPVAIPRIILEQEHEWISIPPEPQCYKDWLDKLLLVPNLPLSDLEEQQISKPESLVIFPGEKGVSG